MNKLGLYFGTDKQGALFRGDTSNTVVHQYFVYSFQAIGMHLGGAPDESRTMVQLQARYCQKAFESLIEIYRTGNQKLKAHGLLSFVNALVIMGFMEGAQLYLSNLCKLIDNANLRFLPAYGRPPELSEQVHEDTVVLSQAMYLVNYFHLTLGHPAPVTTARIEREFQMDLKVRIVRQISMWVRSGLSDLI